MKTLRILVFLMIIAAVFAAAPAGAQTPTPSPGTFSFDLDELLDKALELLNQKKYDEATVLCMRASALHPTSFRPHALFGFIYWEQRKLKSASESFAKAISLEGNNKHLYMAKAQVDMLRNEHEAAIAACRKALELDPSFTEAYLMIGDILKWNEKRRGEAVDAYRAAIKSDPRNGAAYAGLGELLEYAKDEKGAEENYRKAIDLDPQKMAGRFDLGRMLVRQRRLKEARELWDDKFASKDNTFPNFITLLERAERLKAATDALAAKPNDPSTLVAMGNAVMDGDHWVVDGRQERAIEYFKKALRIKPDLAAAQYGIVKAWVEIADTYESKKKNVDEELAKLRKMDEKLAKEMEEYRKTYQGGLQSTEPIGKDQ